MPRKVKSAVWVTASDKDTDSTDDKLEPYSGIKVKQHVGVYPKLVPEFWRARFSSCIMLYSYYYANYLTWVSFTVEIDNLQLLSVYSGVVG